MSPADGGGTLRAVAASRVKKTTKPKRRTVHLPEPDPAERASLEARRALARAIYHGARDRRARYTAVERWALEVIRKAISAPHAHGNAYRREAEAVADWHERSTGGVRYLKKRLLDLAPKCVQWFRDIKTKKLAIGLIRHELTEVCLEFAELTDEQIAAPLKRRGQRDALAYSDAAILAVWIFAAKPPGLYIENDDTKAITERLRHA